MKTILIIDDEERLVSLLATSLAAHDYQVYTHTSFRGAMDAVRQHRPDFVVLDVMLGDGLGYQVAREIRGDTELYHTPVLFISALGEQREIDYSSKQGGDAYLTKPFKLAEILAKLDQLRKLSEEIERPNEMTGLPGLASMAREIDRRLVAGTTFTTCYVTIDNYQPFVKKRGPEKAHEAVQMLGKLMSARTHELGTTGNLVCHLGGEHFMFIIERADYKHVCHDLTAAFAGEVLRFYTSTEVEQGYVVAVPQQGVYAGYPLMSLRICVAHTDDKPYANAQEVIHRLRAMQDKSREHDKERVFTFKQGAKW